MKRRTHKELGRVLSVSVMNVFAKRPRAVQGYIRGPTPTWGGVGFCGFDPPNQKICTHVGFENLTWVSFPPHTSNPTSHRISISSENGFNFMNFEAKFLNSW